MPNYNDQQGKFVKIALKLGRMAGSEFYTV